MQESRLFGRTVKDLRRLHGLPVKCIAVIQMSLLRLMDVSTDSSVGGATCCIGCRS